MDYKVTLPVFEGPLDLLLHLIKKNELDIYDIPIALITNQYMEYIKMMKMIDINIAGEFLVMASTLMHIKSKMLLPQETREEAEDPREELVLQLLEYRRFKEMAEKLQCMEEDQSRYYKRSFLDEVPPEDDGYFHDVDIFDLMSAFKQILERLPKMTDYEIQKEDETIEHKIRAICDLLKKDESVCFEEIFRSNKTREGAILTFLAMLEMMRMRIIHVTQERSFGKVMIYRGENYKEEEHEDAGSSERTERTS